MQALIDEQIKIKTFFLLLLKAARIRFKCKFDRRRREKKIIIGTTKKEKLVKRKLLNE